MKIHFKKKRLRANLILGLAWVGFGIVSLEMNDNVRWTDYGYMVIGLLYLGHYWVDRTWHYLTISEGTIRKNGLHGFGQKINLQDITWIKKFAGDYTLITDQRNMKIDTDLIDPHSLDELNKVLSALNLPADKTPFAQSA